MVSRLEELAEYASKSIAGISTQTAIACCWTVRAARPLRKPPSASLAVAAGAVVEEDREERSNVERPNATAVKPRQAKVQASQGAL